MRWKISNNWVKSYESIEQFSAVEFSAETFDLALAEVANKYIGTYYPNTLVMRVEGPERAVGHYFDSLGNHVMVLLMPFSWSTMI